MSQFVGLKIFYLSFEHNMNQYFVCHVHHKTFCVVCQKVGISKLGYNASLFHINQNFKLVILLQKCCTLLELLGHLVYMFSHL